MMQEHTLFYVQPFVVSMCISAVLCFVIIKICEKIRVRDQRINERHIHNSAISRFGGTAIIIAFVLTLILNKYLVFDQLIWAIICGGGIIFAVGVMDDLRPLSWKSQIFFQMVLVLTVFIFGIRVMYVTNPLGGIFLLAHNDFFLPSLVFMLIWMVLIMNAVNWADGVDGLSGGVVLIAAIALFMISLEPPVFQPPIAIIAMVLAGSVAGFLAFNFPQARIFAGSSGAFFMGFVLAVLAIAAGAKIGTTVLVLGVPLLDSLWVIFCRLRAGRSIFYGDHEHLHYKLLHRGWSVKKILALYYSVTILCAFTAIATKSFNKFVVFVSFCFVVIIFFIVLSYGKTEKKKLSTNY